jgi:hypothetical protein
MEVALLHHREALFLTPSIVRDTGQSHLKYKLTWSAKLKADLALSLPKASMRWMLSFRKMWDGYLKILRTSNLKKNYLTTAQTRGKGPSLLSREVLPLSHLKLHNQPRRVTLPTIQMLQTSTYSSLGKDLLHHLYQCLLLNLVLTLTPMVP